MERAGRPNHQARQAEKFRRSKGCLVCLQRRVKCDEKRPSCTQCLRGGRRCHGSLSTIFFNVDSKSLATTAAYVNGNHSKRAEYRREYPVQKAERMLRTPPQQVVRSNNQELPRPAEGTNVTAPRGLGNGASHLNTSRIPPAMRTAHAVTQQCLSLFIHFYSRVEPRNVVFQTWMNRLPDMLISARDPLIRKCITAASLVYYGRLSNDKRIVAESYRWYGAGLARQRRIIEDLDAGNRKPTIEELCAPIMLSFFETACGTSPTAYFHHLLGAARLLERLGPYKCNEGLLFGLFQTLRLQMLYPTIMMRCPSVFGKEEWLTIPFLEHPKSNVDRIIDIATLTSTLLSRIDLLGNLSGPECDAETLAIKAEALQMKAQLDNIWIDLRPMSQTQGWVGDTLNGIRGFDFNSTKAPNTPTSDDAEDDIATPTLPKLATSNSYATHANASRTMTFYSTARILVLWILQSTDAAPAYYKDQIRAHCACILAAATATTESCIGYAYVRLVLPLRVVAMLGTTKQRMRVREMMGEWAKVRRGLEGICSSAIAGMEESWM